MRSVSADLFICYSCSPLAVAFSAPKASCCWRPSLRSKRQHFESLLTSAKVFASQRLLQSDALPFSCTDCTKSTFIFVFSLVVIMIQEADYLFVCMPPNRARVNCPHDFHLSVKDLDGDKVRCRFASSDKGECVSCTQHSFIELDGVSCISRVQGFIIVGTEIYFILN